jgi:hypothetical protein
MMRASQSGDMKRFERYSRYVYGSPSEEIFEYTVDNLKDKVIKALVSNNPYIKAAAQNLIEGLQGVYIVEHSSEINPPSDETVNIAREKN